MNEDRALHPVTRRLLVAIESEAAALDSQGPLAPAWVSALSLEDIGSAFEVLSADRREVLDHQPDRKGRCERDGHPWPCGGIQGLLRRYIA